MIAELWPFLRLLRGRLGWIAAGAALMLATLAASLGLLATAGWFITATGLAGAALAAGAALTLEIYRPGAAIRFFAIFRVVSRYLERLVTHEATFRVLADLRVWLFGRILAQDHATLGRLRGGQVLNRLTGDIDALDHLYLRVVAPVCVAAVMLLGAMAGFALVSPEIALVSVGILIVSAVCVPSLIGWLGHRPGRAMAREAEDLRLLSVDGVQGMAELRAFAATGRHEAALRSASAAHSDQKRQMAHITGLASALTGLGGNLAIWVAAILGVGLLSAEAISGPGLALILLGLLALNEAVSPLPLAAQYLGHTRAAASRLTALAGTQTSTGAGTADPVQPLPDRNEVGFDSVTFRYLPHDRPVLECASLRLGEGERVAVVGRSGLGKSTLSELILRRHRPEAGRLTLGGVDLQALAEDDIYTRVACLEQKPRLFNTSIAENLWLADEDASPEQLWAALEVAGLAVFVESLPEGLRTQVGEAGVMLSGGEARRLCLARVVLRDAPIVILDEPTAGLDRDTENKVMRNLDHWLGGRSALIVTHTPERLPRVDRVLTLDRGRVVEVAQSALSETLS